MSNHLKPCASFLVLLLLSCGGDSKSGGPAEWPAPTTTGTGSPLGQVAVATIGAAGGSLMSEDTRVTLSIPAGALASDVQVGIQRITEEAPGGVRAYRFTPDGLTFSTPITARMHVDSVLAAGSVRELMTVATQLPNGSWELLKPSAVTLNHGASAFDVQLSHFSDYTILQGLQLRPPSDTVDEGESVTLTVRNCTTIIETSEGNYSSYAVDCDEAPRPTVPDGEDDLPSLPTFTVQSGTWAANGITGGNNSIGRVTGSGATGRYTAGKPFAGANPVAVSVKVRSHSEGVTYTVLSYVTVRNFCSSGNVQAALRAACQPLSLTGHSSSTLVDAEPMYDISAEVEWVYDSAHSIPGLVARYFPRGRATFTPRDACTGISPSEYTWDLQDEGATGSITVTTMGSDSSWTGAGGILWVATYSDLCEGDDEHEGAVGGAYFMGNGQFTGEYNFSGTQSIGGQTFTYSFTGSGGAQLRAKR